MVRDFDEMRTLTFLMDALRDDWSAASGCQASPTSPMLARLASVLHGTRATVTMRPAWATARSTPALRSFCTEPSLKPHVHVSASKAAPTSGLSRQGLGLVAAVTASIASTTMCEHDVSQSLHPPLGTFKSTEMPLSVVGSGQSA